MKSITSVSGGKSSAYMALHYPTDFYVFSVVLTDQSSVAPVDKGLLRECQNRIPGFVASRELDQTLLNVLRLEQVLGQSIDWVCAVDANSQPLTYDALIAKKTYLPNHRTRFCTEFLKVMPIFWHCFFNVMDDSLDILSMNIGFRADEIKRVDEMRSTCQKMHYPVSCPIAAKLRRNKQVFNDIEWRLPSFPMAADNKFLYDVVKFWGSKDWDFPIISNCDGCFHHTPSQIRTQAALYPDRILPWWGELEKTSGKTWINGTTYEEICSTTDLFIPGFDSSKNCFCTD